MKHDHHYLICYKDYSDNLFFYKKYYSHLWALIIYFIFSRMFDIVEIYERKGEIF